MQRLLVLLLFFLVYSAKSQDKSMIFFSNVPQSSFINPAFIPEYTRFVGIPMLSATSLSINSSRFSFKDVAYTRSGPTGDSLLFSFNKILSGLKANNTVRYDVSQGILSFGFKRKKIYWSFNMQLKSFGNIYAPKSVGELQYGNVDYATMQAKDINLSYISANSFVYYETGVAASYSITDNLRFGARLKLLNGVSAIATKRFYARLNTSSDFKTTTIDANIAVNSSVKGLSFNTDANNIVQDVNLSGNILRAPFTSNFGLGVDLGIDGSPSRDLRVFASITDLGFITWNKDLQQITTKGTYVFDGANLTPDANGNIDSKQVFNTIIDTLKNKFQLHKGSSSFSTSLYTKVYAGIEYQALSWLQLGFNLRCGIYDKVIDPSITISGKAKATSYLSTLASLSYYNNTLNNFGLGFVVGNKPVQFYLVADNIPLHFYKSSDYQNSNKTRYLFPSRSRSMNLQLGVNIIFGEKCYKLPWRWKSFETTKGPRH